MKHSLPPYIRPDCPKLLTRFCIQPSSLETILPALPQSTYLPPILLSEPCFANAPSERELQMFGKLLQQVNDGSRNTLTLQYQHQNMNPQDRQPTATDVRKVYTDLQGRDLKPQAQFAEDGKPGPASTRREVLETALSHVTENRQATHGAPEQSFQSIARLWSAYLTNKSAQDGVFATLQVTPADVALMMGLMKTARAQYNPQHPDNWIDLAGYAACGCDVANNA
jgi:hypothetical protein